MHIRTITIGAREAQLDRAVQAAELARQRLTATGYVVQSVRLALAMSGTNSCADMVSIAQGAEQQALDAGFDCVSIGPVHGERLARIATGLDATQALFASAQITDNTGHIDHPGIRVAADAICAISAATAGGLGNMRFAALACVAPGSPFFPAAYHQSEALWMAVGPEAATLALQATSEQAGPVALARLTSLIEQHDTCISAVLSEVAAATQVAFRGCDWSLAPHPQRSIGQAIEALSGVPFGAWGTLTAVRGLTQAIRAARVAQIGFSGVMLPVIEDSVLAQRNSAGYYTLRDLLAFSAVCGTGLDTIPLPGDTNADQIVHVLTEVATLASVLRKPLTARLLPLPGLRAGDLADFDLPADSPLAGSLCGSRVMHIT